MKKYTVTKTLVETKEYLAMSEEDALNQASEDLGNDWDYFDRGWTAELTEEQ